MTCDFQQCGIFTSVDSDKHFVCAKCSYPKKIKALLTYLPSLLLSLETPSDVPSVEYSSDLQRL